MLQVFTSQPLYAPLRALLELLPDDGGVPGVESLNALAAGRGIVSGSGAPLRFVVPHGSGMSYEERAWWLGEVETRPGNWHDYFNALAWLVFPLTKAALNVRHHRVLAEQRSAGRPVNVAGGGRGPLRDALTQFDECGVIVASADLELWEGIRAHRWKQVFWDQRPQVLQSMQVFVFGHASYDLLRNPHLGLCGKAIFLHVDDVWLARPLADRLKDIDAHMARRFSGGPGGLGAYSRPRDFHPLPLLGIPGATPENASALYYENTRQFRPLRVVGD